MYSFLIVYIHILRTDHRSFQVMQYIDKYGNKSSLFTDVLEFIFFADAEDATFLKGQAGQLGRGCGCSV